MKIFSISSEEIEQAIKSPYELQNGKLLEMVIEQIYHEAIYFKKTSMTEIYEKLNKDDAISIERLEQQLSFYQVTLTNDERFMLSNTFFENEMTAEKLIPFRKLVEISMSNSSTNIEFRLKLQEIATTVEHDKNERFRGEWSVRSSEKSYRKSGINQRKLELMDAR